jgi:hypothetical protein
VIAAHLGDTLPFLLQRLDHMADGVMQGNARALFGDRF